MLDSNTKKNIDDARDILVGKIPDPKSQVEQITIALIYKFMCDMDKQSIEDGGVASYFVDDFEKYTWDKIISTAITGQARVNLYIEAIEQLANKEMPNIPPLFKSIFKNSYLPFRDPQTLHSFLKVIDNFDYHHSEKLGDAFEYLLSVLGSQGDAGQFRTPRHIIDFVVGIIQPQKNEIILDPACGTAGFLISAYKYIKDNNKLSISENKQLVNNLAGYDISPDMVKLSLVNMYLHKFSQPKIEEYDTLTSSEKWGDYSDVILANPPFMTPKGGIKPHDKFSLK